MMHLGLVSLKILYFKVIPAIGRSYNNEYREREGGSTLCFIQAGSLCLAMTAWGLSSHVQGGDPT